MMKHKSARALAALFVPLALGAAVLGTTGADAAPAAAAAPPAGCTGPASQTWLNVVVDGVKNSNGLVAVTLYADDASKFLVKRGSLYVGRVDAQSGTTRACIFVPRTGVYALALYHDENANRSFDRTGIGFPAEGFGFSNNPATLAGLPTFKSVRLNVPKSGLTTRIHMKYP
ncbi:DUF2141 domain-containing protein [Novosphingobium sp.]|uniref:DUF2141 domain-containing protein n=1 Tax=Novosphingobium sp. TaxID=1874826 RepID=UPI0035B4057C